MNDQINLNQEALVINFVSPTTESDQGDDKNYRIIMRNKTFSGTSRLKLEVQNDNQTAVRINEIRYSVNGGIMETLSGDFPLDLGVGEIIVMNEVFITSDSVQDSGFLPIDINFNIEIPVSGEEKTGTFTILATGESIAA